MEVVPKCLPASYPFLSYICYLSWELWRLGHLCCLKNTLSLVFVEIVCLAPVVFVLVWLDIGVICFVTYHPGSNGFVQFLHNMELGSYSLHSWC